MSDPTTVTAQTNTIPKSCVDVNCSCDTMWSFAQQFSTVRLCTHTGEQKGKLVRDYSVRARRIAGTYARFYLESEDGGNPDMKGRYYWMALGAFASKTVACTFDAWQVQGMTYVDETVWEGLGKGNFWLFCDISGWHWYRNMYPKSFDQCLSQRNAQKYVGPVKDQLKQLPWQAEALAKIKNFTVSKEIIAGFKKVDEFESALRQDRPRIQRAHLIEIAKHEQGVILQPLIYDDENFAARVRLQRAWYSSWASPPIELVFTHACSTEGKTMKSIAPPNTELESFESRMKWILTTADQFHTLMQQQLPAIEAELRVIAGWKDMPDSLIFKEKAAKKFPKLRRILD